MDSTTEPSTHRDPLLAAFAQLDTALAAYARWPSKRRRRAVIVSLNTVLELYTDAVSRAVSAQIARLEAQQGRHELRISRLEDKGGVAREVGA